MATPMAVTGDPGPIGVRLIHIITYLLILAAVRFVLWGVLLFQFVAHLMGTAPHSGAQKLGFVVADYVYRVWLYLTYHTNDRPFPFRRQEAAGTLDD